MMFLVGEPAFSNFRIKKLVCELEQAELPCSSLQARYIYFLDIQDALNAQQLERVETLINVAQGSRQVVSAHNNHFCSIPRIGTISPWSSKATDIFHLCGLSNVRRVERGIYWQLELTEAVDQVEFALAGLLYDPMIESFICQVHDAHSLFETTQPAPLTSIDLLQGGLDTLAKVNQECGFALSEQEQIYLRDKFFQMGRNPTDVELMMFAQVNSEHCRHKIFNADWKIDGEIKSASLFSMIRQTHQHNSKGTLTAYSDNAAVLTGHSGKRLLLHGESGEYRFVDEEIHFIAKVETHNHPTAISPYPGAATGSGGEIRDEGATGCGGKPKAGFVGFSVSHLHLPGNPEPWELSIERPKRLASPLQIMVEGPLGAAAFNNEFGRANIAGYFRSFEFDPDEERNTTLGYHKPIMLAGGLGNIRSQDVKKKNINNGTPILVLGGPAMLIGLGGGAASSLASGEQSETLDFASVQRGNPEMQRRCQEVIDSCCAMTDANPIVSIHDVGAGGLCNALPELVHDCGVGGDFELRDILNDEPGMSPMQIWCNESQERYVLAVKKECLDDFEKICVRERCLYAVIGWATKEQKLVLNDDYFQSKNDAVIKPIDLSMDVLFGLQPKICREANSHKRTLPELNFSEISVDQAAQKVLNFPAVGDKSFLITIGDRSVGGLVARDQMVGPWQVPVADVGVTSSGFHSITGEAMAIGERTPLAVVNAPASGRMAVAEAITNIAAAYISSIDQIKLSANWMVAAAQEGQDAALYETVQSVALDLCKGLGIAIPVGKDSMSMKTKWKNKQDVQQKVISPLSLVVSAFAPVQDVRKTMTPQLIALAQDTELWLVDLGGGKNRMAGSVLAQVTNQFGNAVPDLDHIQDLADFFDFVHGLNEQCEILAYHDRSDGGLFTSLSEMAFAGRTGIDIELTGMQGKPLEILFNEELGAVIQVSKSSRQTILDFASKHNLQDKVHCVAKPNSQDRIEVHFEGEKLFSRTRADCHADWSKVSWHIQRLRDNPKCADAEYARIQHQSDSGLFAKLTFDMQALEDSVLENFNIQEHKPRVAILREQGVNGQLEMAAAFKQAGFKAIDITTTDLVAGQSLSEFNGLVACGGFSFGDVLGAGQGWGKSILYNAQLKDEFEGFFHRQDTFTLGVCNGCQMLSSIKKIIPGAGYWPKFVRNLSEQYEARFVMVEVASDHSIFFKDMQGCMMPVSTAHAEGQTVFSSLEDISRLRQAGQISLNYVDHLGVTTESYPYNPNGSPQGLTGFCNESGRVTIMMPHPERVFRTNANSWHPPHWGQFSGWMKIFLNAYQWVK